MLRAVQPSVGREGWRWEPSGRWGNTAVRCEYNERPASSEGDTPVAKLKCLARARENGASAPPQRIIEGGRKAVGAPAREPAAEGDRVEVWLGPVQALAAGGSYREILSANELLALDQIKSPALRSRKLAGRALLRTALSHVVNGRINPREWRIYPDANGRPFIAKSMP